MLTPTAELSVDDLEQVIALLQDSFEDFSAHDWGHCLGGLHSLVHEDGQVVAHAALTQRRLWTGGRSLRCGYVEGVAVAAHRRREGLGRRVMLDLQAVGRGYEILALSATEQAVGFYESLRWRGWRGPTSVIAPDGMHRTPEDDGSVYVRATLFDLHKTVDLDAPIACDWRDGDVW